MYTLIAKNRRNSVLFIIGFFVLFAFIGYLMYWLTGNLWAMVFTVIGSGIYVWIVYAMQSKVTARLTSSRPLQPGENPNLESLVLSMSLAANMQPPPIQIIDSPAPNAFAAGTKPENSVIGFTTGLLNMLTKPELEGVIAHELSHIRNQDTRYKTIIFVLASGIALIADIGLRMLFWSSMSRNNNANALPLLLVPLIVVAIVLPISKLMQLAAGREREYYADISGIELTRYPEGLASALHKISATPAPAIRGVSTSTSHLFISNPFAGSKNFLVNMFSTHPPTEKRIQRILEQGSRFS